MEVLTQVAQFILSLSILIVLHEMGHFVPAKLFKTRVEKFYLFFDPWFSIFKYKKGETEYGIGWLPLGGYVKISGMIDESMDKEQMKLPPQEWEFRAKPAWQRLIIMLGGVTVNAILGILIYAMVLFAWGEQTLPIKNLKYGIAVDSLGYQIGLRDGDNILSLNNKPVEDFITLPIEIMTGGAETIQVDRNGKKMDIAITKDDINTMLKTNQRIISARVPCEVDTVIGESAIKAGLKKGDKIIAVNNDTTPYLHLVKKSLKNNRNLSVALTILRGKDTVKFNTKVSEDGTIGFANNDYIDIETTHYGLVAAFPAGIHKAGKTFDSYIKQMKMMFTVKEAHKQLGGFATIASAYSTSWDWQSFWAFTAFLSIVLAIMNVLPIPALDGGHVMFLLYEVITGRKPNEKVMEYAQYAGMILLLALLLYANGNDVLRWFHK